jgi:hypothetical protein
MAAALHERLWHEGFAWTGLQEVNYDGRCDIPNIWEAHFGLLDFLRGGAPRLAARGLTCWGKGWQSIFEESADMPANLLGDPISLA